LLYNMKGLFYLPGTGSSFIQNEGVQLPKPTSFLKIGIPRACNTHSCQVIYCVGYFQNIPDNFRQNFGNSIAQICNPENATSHSQTRSSLPFLMFRKQAQETQSS